ncbi:peptidoglycan DD-metalloendopeptidase family protein [Listeria aquatica]|uniref:Peptidase family M23 protein n=1 Tax=Listeria aquatica FSL S10-1188 TaxID=1265818 RepID=W7B1I5_9LIST|nr:M23 family metallopeptidase [Listeria aquatica]EUJ16561.1 peptidase family M23 protein [Listeria aquatica FSL S10-1188]
MAQRNNQNQEPTKSWGLLILRFLSVKVILIVILLFVGISALGVLIGGSTQQDTLGVGGGCSVSGELNEETFNQTLEQAGVFKGKGNLFISIAKEQNIDPVLFAAIAMSETGWGTSKAVVEKNNPGGIMDSATGMSTVKRFSSLKEGMEAMGVTLHNRIVVDGLTTIEKLGNVYAPIGVANDPNNLNANWIPTVTAIADKFGGLTMNCSNTGSSGGTGKYIIPVKNPRVSSGFSDRINPVTGVHESHKGLDFAQPIGSDILAADDGKVVVVMKPAVSGSGFGGYGFVTLIEHGKNKEWTLYGHQSEILVKVGQKVKQGQVIGKVGSTGQSTGPHLHFEIRKKKMGGQVDPAPVLGVLATS